MSKYCRQCKILTHRYKTIVFAKFFITIYPIIYSIYPIIYLFHFLNIFHAVFVVFTHYYKARSNGKKCL